MANFFSTKGTTQQTFQIGAGNGKSPFTLDASSFTSPHTWKLPDSDGTGGYTLATDGSGNLFWSAAGASTPYVPLTVHSGESFTVPTNTQVLFSEPINAIGDLIVNGDLIDVNPASTAVASQVPTYLGYGTSFTVGHNKQALFAEPITVFGDLIVNGDLIDVSPVPVAPVTPVSYTHLTLPTNREV